MPIAIAAVVAVGLWYWYSKSVVAKAAAAVTTSGGVRQLAGCCGDKQQMTAGPTTVYLAVQGATTNTSTSQAPVTAPTMTPVGVVAAAMGGGALRHQTSGEHVSGTPWGRWSRPTTPSLSSGPGVVMGPVAGGHSIDHVSGGGYNGVNLSRRA